MHIGRDRGTSFFPVKHEKLPPSYIQDAKNFSVVKPLNSGEAHASPASPVPRPLLKGIKKRDDGVICIIGPNHVKKCKIYKNF